ncbi:putative multidrug resistance protein EmrK [Aquisphaera giovannonii]|uniref:Putative multidrug resistance protein EmrK n=1 Tax=Aquisphaera giovannonii TaxID=406548 RepID=A0A5B9W8P7_9BACT|nr:HlyD family secretion protein [Aquisphaera giovannonii]QEH36634.1 putative multidrug resistance protein EmrK [Aquisphaera giovannonii]
MATTNGSASGVDEGHEIVARNGHATEDWGGARFPVDSQFVVDTKGTRTVGEEHSADADPDAAARAQEKKDRRRRRVRTLIILLVLGLVVGAGLYFGVPMVREALRTVSTDDAFVAGHITNVSPRVEDLVTEVLVEENDRVEPGMILVRLDREPFEIRVQQAESNLEQARANLVNATAQVRAQLARARAAYYQRQNAQERLRQQVATLHARFATLRARESSFRLAELDQRRIEALVRRGSATQSELDTQNNRLDVNREEMREAREQVQEARALLGLRPNYEHPLDLPPDLEVNQSAVQSAVSDIATSLAEIGISIDPNDAAQARAFQDFIRPKGDKAAGEGVESLLDQAPGVRVARAAVGVAEKGLADARLRLSYTEIRAEVAGHVQDRTVNPGNRVQPGQTLLSIRPDYVWIEANYKETQLRYIRIGMPVDVEVDAYPGRVFRARVAGFSPGTGLAGSLLPPENATGNYIKVTQRLPVRIELAEPNPADTPLFVGLSVVPKVRFEESPSGPGAGQRLHEADVRSRPSRGEGPAGRYNGDGEGPSPEGGPS